MSEQQSWFYEESDGIGSLTVDVPERSVNVLSGAVPPQRWEPPHWAP